MGYDFLASFRGSGRVAVDSTTVEAKGGWDDWI